MDFKDLVKSKFNDLSESQQKIAKYILNNLEEAVFCTATQLGEKTLVSETSIIRFSYALGFKRYSDMTKSMQESILKGLKKMNQGSPVGTSLSELSSTQLLDHFESIIQGNRAYSNIDIDEFKKICDIIMEKEKVLIIGYMDSFGVASELLHLLDKFRKNVYFLRLLHEENILYDMDEDSLVIAVSFAPHYKYTLEHTVTAKNGGCSLITFTDSIINPFTNLSDYSLVFNLQRNPEIDLIDSSPVTRFNYFLSNYIYTNYRNQVDKYRTSVERRIEQYIE